MKTTVLTGRLSVVFSVLAVLCALPGCSSRLVSSDPTGKSQEEEEEAAAVAEVEVTVTRVTDGDTVRVSPEVDGEYRVRFIGVDTSETTPAQGPEPYGEEASRFTRESLEGRNVSLEFDAEREDDYGRLLAYAYLPDGAMFNETLVREGYAQVATFTPNTRYLERLEEAQVEAREARQKPGRRGVGSGGCRRASFAASGTGGTVSGRLRVTTYDRRAAVMASDPYLSGPGLRRGVRRVRRLSVVGLRGSGGGRRGEVAWGPRVSSLCLAGR